MGSHIISRRSRHFLVGIIVCVFYNDWIFGLPLNSRLSPTRAMISELSASTQPHHWTFQTMDVSVGVLTLALLPRVLRFVGRRQGWLGRMLTLCFGLIGLDSIIDASLPLACAPSADPHCSLAAIRSFNTEAHMLESLLIGIVTFAAPLLWWHWHRSRHQLLARASWWFAGVQVAVGLAILAAWAANWQIVGACQRVYQLGIGAWMGLVVTLSLGKYRQAANSTPEPEPTGRPSPQAATPALAEN